MSKKRQQAYNIGLRAENLATLWLRCKGYCIVARRYKVPFGEIDLIVRRGKLLAFVEVKARSTQAQALESLTPTMKRRIEAAAGHYISCHQCEGMDLRFDLITFSPPFFIQHLDNAWQQRA